MNVQELIDRLLLIEDKTLPVCIEDWNEGYVPPREFNLISWVSATNYSVNDVGCYINGNIILLGESQ